MRAARRWGARKNVYTVTIATRKRTRSGFSSSSSSSSCPCSPHTRAHTNADNTPTKNKNGRTSEEKDLEKGVTTHRHIYATFVGLSIVVEGTGGEDEFSELLARMFAVDPRILPVFYGNKRGSAFIILLFLLSLLSLFIEGERRTTWRP